MRPAPLDLPSGAGVDVAVVVAEWFGKGPVVLGTLVPRGHLVHRADLARGFAAAIPACAQTSHGQLMTIVHAIAVVPDQSVAAALRVLDDLEQPRCRLCSRCWRAARGFHHRGRECWAEERGVRR